MNKICLFIPSMEGGGAERVFANLANYLEDKKVNYNLLLGFKKGPNLKKINNNNIISLESRGRYFLFKFIKYLWKEKPTQIYSTLLSANFFNSLARLMYFNKCKHILREANIIILPDNFFKKLLIIIIYQFYYLANKIIVNSNDTRLSLLKVSPFLKNKIIVIPNPVFFEKDYTKNFKLKTSNDDTYNFLAIGRLVEQKNFKLLINSFNFVQKDYKSTLTIVGDGELKDNLINLVSKLNLKNKINIYSYQNDLSYFINTKTIFVLSSKYEGFGNVVVEALMYGLPIVSTNCPGGPIEILQHGKFGYISKQNINDFSKKMIEAIQDHKKNKIDILKLRNRSLDFTVEKIAKKYFNL